MGLPIHGPLCYTRRRGPCFILSLYTLRNANLRQVITGDDLGYSSSSSSSFFSFRERDTLSRPSSPSFLQFIMQGHDTDESQGDQIDADFTTLGANIMQSKCANLVTTRTTSVETRARRISKSRSRNGAAFTAFSNQVVKYVT